MEDVTLLFTLGAIPIKISLSHPMGLLAGGRPHLKWLALVLPYSGNPKGRFDTAFSLGIIPKINAPFLSPFGGCWQGAQLLALVIPHPGNPKERFEIC